MIHKKTSLTFYFIRHGECEGNLVVEKKIGGRVWASPLTETGRKQAEQLSRRLQKYNFDQIFCSPQTRTMDTARIALPFTRIRKAKPLVEFSQGRWEGRSRKKTLTKDVLLYLKTKGHTFVPPGGESVRMVESRVLNWFEKKFLNNPKYWGKKMDIAIITHTMVIRCFLHYVMGLSHDMINRITVGYCSITKLVFDHEGWHVITINSEHEDN